MLNDILLNHIALTDDAINMLEADGLQAFNIGMDEHRNTALQEPPFLDPVEWIKENIEITTGFRRGNLDLSGFQSPVATAAMDPETDQITVLKGVQVGWSTFMKSMLFYGVSYLALSAIVTQPTNEDAEGYYKDQIEQHLSEPFFEFLRRKPKRGEAADTWNEHRFKNGGRLYFRGAASDDAFRRISAEWQMADEIDAEAWQSKSEKRTQGDKIALYRDRGTAFARPILWAGSTPVSRESSLVWREWLLSDQRRFYVNCPHCGGSQNMKWGTDKTEYGFRWTLNEHAHVVDAWYVCEVSGCRIDEEHKEDMVKAGEYIATAIPNRPGHRGFHWPAWHSMAPMAAWRSLATQWISAQNAMKSGDVNELKRFINNVMAEPWDDLGGQSLDADSIQNRQVFYEAEVPDDVVVITAGIDTQTNKEGLKGGDADMIASREVTVVGWNKAKMPRIICHQIVEGEPGDSSSDAELDAILDKKYSKRDGTELSISGKAIDMGGSFGDQVKAYALSRNRKGIWAIKGKNNKLGTRSATVWPRKVSRNTRAGTHWYMIDTQLAKDAVSRMLSIKGPGGPLFPDTLPASYFDGLASEKVFTNKAGQRFWKRTGKNTGEEWDCLIYAYAALCGLQASYREYRDLNLAARRLGIEDTLPPHDPETGELMDEAPAVISSRSTTRNTAGKPQRHGAVEQQKKEPPAAPKPVVKRKKSGGIVRSSTARRWS